MTTPTIHNNGTSAQELCELYHMARYALEVAMCEVSKSCPNARDYYPQGADAMAAALSQHRARLDALEKVRAELEALELFTADQIK